MWGRGKGCVSATLPARPLLPSVLAPSDPTPGMSYSSFTAGAYVDQSSATSRSAPVAVPVLTGCLVAAHRRSRRAPTWRGNWRRGCARVGARVHSRCRRTGGRCMARRAEGAGGQSGRVEFERRRSNGGATPGCERVEGRGRARSRCPLNSREQAAIAALPPHPHAVARVHHVLGARGLCTHRSISMASQREPTGLVQRLKDDVTCLKAMWFAKGGGEDHAQRLDNFYKPQAEQCAPGNGRAGARGAPVRRAGAVCRRQVQGSLPVGAAPHAGGCGGPPDQGERQRLG